MSGSGIKIKHKIFLLYFSCYLVAAGSTPKTENEDYDIFLRSLYSSHYYDTKTNQTLKQLPAPYVPGYKPGAKQPFVNLCDCDNLRCSCCAGIRIYGLGLDRQVCSIFTYEPKGSLIEFEFKMNDHSLYRNKFSTKEQQICVPVLHVGIIRNVKFCFKFYDVTVVGLEIVEQKLHACLNMITYINNVPFVTLDFSCMEMGITGVGVARPGGEGYQQILPIPEVEAGPEPVNNSSIPYTTTEANQENSDVFNPVTDNKIVLNS